MTTDPITHYTDGAGPIDGNIDYGPPPLAAVWKPGEECHIALVDPDNPVFVTIHDSNGGSSVVQYAVGATPGTFPADVSALVQGHSGVLTLTWNIGTGVSAPFAYDCSPPATTTTTVAPATTTTTLPVTTTTAIQIDCQEDDPCWDCHTMGNQICGPTSTVATVGVPNELPHTGFDNADLGMGAFGALGVGALFVLGARFWKAHR